MPEIASIDSFTIFVGIISPENVVAAFSLFYWIIIHGKVLLSNFSRKEDICAKMMYNRYTKYFSA